MARRKKHRSRRAKAIPVAPLIPLAVVAVRSYQQSGSAGAKLDALMKYTTGYNWDAKDFQPEQALPFWMGTVAGVVVHKAANKIGVNNMIRRATFGYLSL